MHFCNLFMRLKNGFIENTLIRNKCEQQTWPLSDQTRLMRTCAAHWNATLSRSLSMINKICSNGRANTQHAQKVQQIYIAVNHGEKSRRTACFIFPRQKPLRKQWIILYVMCVWCVLCSVFCVNPVFSVEKGIKSTQHIDNKPPARNWVKNKKGKHNKLRSSVSRNILLLCLAHKHQRISCMFWWSANEPTKYDTRRHTHTHSYWAFLISIFMEAWLVHFVAEWRIWRYEFIGSVLYFFFLLFRLHIEIEIIKLTAWRAACARLLSHSRGPAHTQKQNTHKIGWFASCAPDEIIINTLAAAVVRATNVMQLGHLRSNAVTLALSLSHSRHFQLYEIEK